MRILFLTDNFPPEVNAPATRTYEHCRRWVELGAQVTVITCAPNFPQGEVYAGYKNRLYQREVMAGIEVIRVWSYIAKNEGFLKRTLDFISYACSAFLAGLFHKTDLIVATSPQFFTALAGMSLSFFKRQPWVMEVRDLWPESIAAVGAMNKGIMYRFFEWLELRCYDSAKRVVVVTDAFKRKLIERGVNADKIDVIKNGVCLETFSPRSKDQVLVDELGLVNKVVIGYVGTHGMAHKLDFILRCAKRLESDSKYHFLFLGTGGEKENLLKLKDELRCTNVTMLDPVAKAEVGRYLSVVDIALINLRKSELFTTVIPSKIFENAAMQCPILIGVDGEAREIVEGYGAGLFFEPENENSFVTKLGEIVNRDVYARCQEGCVALAKDFDRNRLAERMMQECIRVIIEE